MFKSSATQFQTIIFASVGDVDGDLSEMKLTDRQQNILNLIKESPALTAKMMAETLSVSSRTIEREISKMKRIGILEREGKDNAGLWIIKY